MLNHRQCMQFCVFVSLLVNGSDLLAMYVSSQQIPLIGSNLFTGSRLPALVAFTKIGAINDFFLLVRFTDKHLFGVSDRASAVGKLRALLFPSADKKTFIFDSRKVQEYKNALGQDAQNNKSSLLTWRNSQKSWYKKAYHSIASDAIQNDQQIKIILEQRIDSFAAAFNKLVKFEALDQPTNMLVQIGMALVPENQKNIVQTQLINELFDNFQTPQSVPPALNIRSNNLLPLGAPKINELEDVIKLVMTAQFCAVVNLAEANLTTALPRALYYELEKLGRELHVGIPSFGTYIFSSKFAKTLAVGGMGMGLGALFFSRAKSGGVK